MTDESKYIIKKKKKMFDMITVTIKFLTFELYASILHEIVLQTD